MRAGRLRHRITIQHLERTQNNYGEPVEKWRDEAVIWASVEPLRGDEYFKGSDFPQKVAQVEVRMRIRPRTGLNPGAHRIEYKGRIYDLVSVVTDNWSRETQLMVKAAATDQPDGSTVNY